MYEVEFGSPNTHLEMSLLHILPLEVGVYILEDWLDDWSAFGRLDHAYCNQEERPRFLELMSSLTLPSSPDHDRHTYKLGVESLRWIVSRGVKFKRLSCWSFCPPDHENALALMDSLFSNTGEKVTKIKITDVPGFCVLPDDDDEADDDESDDVVWEFKHPNFLVNFWVNIVQHCPNLTHFSAHHTTGFLCVLRKCQNLIAVNVRDCASFDLQAMQELVQQAPALKELKVCRTKVCDNALEVLATKRPLLTKLHCTGCSAVTVLGVLAIVERFDNLQELCTKHMGGSVLAKIAQCCPNFRSLRTNRKVSDASLLALLEHCKMEVLDITHSFITAQTFCQLRNMTKIRLGGVSDINDAALETLAKQNPRLLELSSKGFSNITKNGVEHLVARCSLIKSCFLMTAEPEGNTLFTIARRNNNVELIANEVIDLTL